MSSGKAITVDTPADRDYSTTVLAELREILYNSQFFNRPGMDERSQFWNYYEHVAKEYDEEFLERQNTNLGNLLIFVSLLIRGIFISNATECNSSCSYTSL